MLGLSFVGPACRSERDRSTVGTQAVSIDYADQIRRLSEAVRQDSSNVDLLSQLGRLYLDSAFSLLYRSRGYQTVTQHYHSLGIQEKRRRLAAAYLGRFYLMRALQGNDRRADVFRALGDYYLNVHLARGGYQTGDTYLTNAIGYFTASLAWDSSSAVAYRRLGLLATIKGDLGKAISFLKKAVALDPSDGSGWMLLGDAYLIGNDHKAAWDAYHEAMVQGFDTPEHYLHMASVYRADDVEVVFHKSIQDIPAGLKSYFNLGVEWFRKNPDRRAIELCNTALSMDSAFYSVYALLAEEFFAAGDTQNAVRAAARCFAPESSKERTLDYMDISPNQWFLINYDPALVERMIAADPRNPRLWYAIGAHGQGFDSSSAVTAYEKVLALDPEFPGINAALGSVYFKRGDTAKAAKYFETAYNRSDDTVVGVSGWYGMVDFCVKRNDRARVLRILKREVERQPFFLFGASVSDSTLDRLWMKGQTDSTIYDAWAYCLFGQELSSQSYRDTLHRVQYNHDALEAFKTAVKSSPAFVPAYYGMGEVLAEKGDFSSAIQSYKTGLKNDPDNVFVHAQLGWALERNGQYAEAVASFKRSLALDPDPRTWSSETYSSYGHACAEGGSVDEAIEAYEKSLRLSSDDPLTLYRAGLAYEKKADQVKAAENFERAAKLGNKNAATKLRAGGK
jgi:protein O-GlcNAc transferase